MSELQLHGFNLSASLFASSISVPEDKVTCRSKRDGGDGTKGVQLPLIITMLTDVILPIFVPGGEKKTLSREDKYQTVTFITDLSPVDQNKVKCVSGCLCDGIPNIFQSWSPRGGQTCHPRVSVG